jgi:mannose-6-phosphate isomerase
MILVKFLDSAIRLCFQAHPSAAFARRFLQADSGKTEAYHILGVRPETDPAYIYMGFQRPPSRAEMRRMVEEQDIAALERCFDRIPVRPGDTFVIPAGFPHALGEGLFLVEIQEPTDFVARYEFERAGYVLPEGARFMGRGVDFGLDLADFTARSIAEIDRDYRCRPRRLGELGPDSWQEELIGPNQTPCFSVRRTRLGGKVLRPGGGFYIGIVTSGEVTAAAGGEEHRLGTYDRFIAPAGLESLTLTAEGGAEILECHPPAAAPAA